jgi:hypothetical protein
MKAITSIRLLLSLHRYKKKLPSGAVFLHKRAALTVIPIRQFYMYLSGENLSEERFFPRTPFPKTFNRILPPYRAHLKK